MPRTLSLALALILASATLLRADSKTNSAPPRESDFYQLTTFAIPDDVVLEAGALEMLPGDKLAISTRRGEIWLVDHPYAKQPETESKFTRFAHGLHEVLGLAYRDGWLYVMQRCELSRIKDTDGDGKADLFETVADGWEISGDYHEYAFGSKFDNQGNLWMALCLTGSFTSDIKFRGWALRLTPDGKLLPTCSGLRSPGGIGMNADGDMFYTENQGPWNGACSLKHLKPGAFLGHPAGLRWFEFAPALGSKPKEPESGGRLMAEAKKIPELEPPAVYFPYAKMGQSASGIACDTTGGAFGPFKNQMFVGDQSSSFVMRVDLEKVKGHYQGACIPFREGFSSGCLPLLLTPKGSMFIGGTNRGWGSRGSKPYSLERLDWTGRVPFEIHKVHARHDGFELTFTQPVDPKTATDPASYKILTYTYIYQATYGSPEVDQTEPKIESLTLSDDRLSIRLVLSEMAEGHIHELHLDGLRSAQPGLPLLHNVAYYSLNYVPEEDKK